MPKQRTVATTAGAGFTSILATIPLHYFKIWADADRNVAALEYQLPDDSFATTYTTDASIGDVIERIGPGRHGLLGAPAAFSASGQAATTLIKVRYTDGTSRNVNIYESETNL